MPPTKNGATLSKLSQFTIKRLVELRKIADAKIRRSDEKDGDRRAITELEEVFGCSFRNPKTKELSFNPQGEELVRLTRQFLGAFENYYDDCQAASNTISIAAGDSLLHLIVIPKLSAIQAQLPRAIFNLEDLRTEGLLRGLRDGHLDFAILQDEALKEMTDIKKQEIGYYSYAVFCSKKTIKSLNDQSIKQVPFALIRQHWGHAFPQLADSAGVKLNVRVRCETFTHVARLVRLGGYAGILPKVAQSIVVPDSEFHSITPSFLANQSFRVVLAANTKTLELKPSTREIFQLLAKEFKFNF